MTAPPAQEGHATRPPGSAARTTPALPVGRYRLTFEPRSASDAARAAALRRHSLGSAWRGAFGHALKRSVCVTKMATCDGCPLLAACPYPYLFESRTPPDAGKLTRYPFTPGPYVLEPGPPRHLGVTLFGSANEHLPTLVEAFARAAGRGITDRKLMMNLACVEMETPSAEHSRRLWRSIGRSGPRPLPILQAPDPAPAAVRVRLLDTLRLRREGRNAGPEDIDARTFTATLLRRISLLTYFFSDTPLDADFAGLVRHAEGIRIDPALKWRDGVRRSTRQQAIVPLGGVSGQFVLQGDLGPLWPYLWLGQWTHVGKACSMGLGRYVLRPVPGATGGWPVPAPL